MHIISAFRIRTVGNTLCGGIVVIATCIANAHTLDDATDSLSLRFLLWYKLRAAVDANAVLRYNAELDTPCRLQWLIYMYMYMLLCSCIGTGKLMNILLVPSTLKMEVIKHGGMWPQNQKRILLV